MKYTTIIFDLDGTLLNTLADLAAATNHALAEHKLPQRTTDEVRQFVGNGIRKLIERAVPADTPAGYRQLQLQHPCLGPAPGHGRAGNFAGVDGLSDGMRPPTHLL